MELKKSNQTGKLVGALVLGAAIGGALGLLFAPQKGRAMRDKIASKSCDFSDAMKIKLHMQTEQDLNSKILNITLKITDEYPELSKYLDEMPVTIPDQNHPEITIRNLKAYYETLNSILCKYKVLHAENLNNA